MFMGRLMDVLMNCIIQVVCLLSALAPLTDLLSPVAFVGKECHHAVICSSSSDDRRLSLFHPSLRSTILPTS